MPPSSPAPAPSATSSATPASALSAEAALTAPATTEPPAAASSDPPRGPLVTLRVGCAGTTPSSRVRVASSASEWRPQPAPLAHARGCFEARLPAGAAPGATLFKWLVSEGGAEGAAEEWRCDESGVLQVDGSGNSNNVLV